MRGTRRDQGQQDLRTPVAWEHLQTPDAWEQWRSSTSRLEMAARLSRLLAVIGRDAAAGPDTEDDETSGLSAGGSLLDAPAQQEPRTTVMIHNIPNTCTPEQLVEAWPHDGTYDLLYAPTSPGGRRVAGFVFVNFVSAAHAVAFKSLWHGSYLPAFRQGRRLRLAWAHIQGFEANMEQLRKRMGSLQRVGKHGFVVVDSVHYSGLGVV